MIGMVLVKVMQKKLVAGKEVELESPPQSFLDGGYLVEAKPKKERE